MPSSFLHGMYKIKDIQNKWFPTNEMATAAYPNKTLLIPLVTKESRIEEIILPKMINESIVPMV